MVDFFGGLGGLGGLDPQIQQQLQRRALSQGLLQAGAGLLQAGGPSPVPISFGQAFGRGLQGFGQGTQAGAQSFQNEQLRALQIRAAQAKLQQQQKQQQALAALQGDPSSTAALGLTPERAQLFMSLLQSGNTALAGRLLESPKAPTVREIKRGNKIITTRFNPQTRTFEPIAEAPRFKPDEGGGGPFAGTGITAQDSNILLRVNDKLTRGEAVTPSEVRQYSLAVSRAEQEKVITQPDGSQALVRPRLPSGFARPEQLTGQTAPNGQQRVIEFDSRGNEVGPQPSAPEGGSTTITPLQGRKPKPPAQAGLAAAIKVGSEELAKARNQIIDRRTGEVDRQLVFTLGRNVPFTEGRLVRGKLLDAFESKIRSESGAAVPQEEIERLFDRFMPSMLDSDKQIKDKLNRLQRFFDIAISEFDPALAKQLRERR